MSQLHEPSEDHPPESGITTFLPGNLDQPPSWEQLRGFANSKAVKFTALAPFVGYLILFNNELSAYFQMNASFENAGFTIYRLYLLYFGLSFLGIGSILFHTICPRVIRDNDNFHSYVRNEMAALSKERSTHLWQAAQVYFYGLQQTSVLDEIGHCFDLASKENAYRSEQKYKPPIIQLWNLYDGSKPTWRHVIFWLYALGLILLAIPSLEGFYQISSGLFFDVIQLSTRATT
jgi:hypothetical protein